MDDIVCSSIKHLFLDDVTKNDYYLEVSFTRTLEQRISLLYVSHLVKASHSSIFPFKLFANPSDIAFRCNAFTNSVDSVH